MISVCYCRNLANLKTSWSNDNPDRRFTNYVVWCFEKSQNIGGCKEEEEKTWLMVLLFVIFFCCCFNEKPAYVIVVEVLFFLAKMILNC